MTSTLKALNSESPPSLVFHMNAATLWNLPDWSRAPKDLEGQISELQQWGVDAIQHPIPAFLADFDIPIVGMGRINEPADADRIGQTHKNAGYLMTTIHVGTGMESDSDMDALVEPILKTSDRLDYPILIETHRATITQDIRRTLDLIDRFPDIRFNADLSHWYTGHEMTYGDISAKFDLLIPVFDRVRYIHGRIGTPCCAQVAVQTNDDRAFVEHFREMWKRCMVGFNNTATQGELLPFAPELLPHSMPFGEMEHYFYYARLLGDRGEDDHPREESDRWVQAQYLWDIAKESARAAGLPIKKS
ncbi:MAG: hypothetical protein AAF292_16970 [Pseudomonadota bacterium]